MQGTKVFRVRKTVYGQERTVVVGKNILVTNREQWSEEKIILAYRSQYLIEDVFKELKDRRIGS